MCSKHRGLEAVAVRLEAIAIKPKLNALTCTRTILRALARMHARAQIRSMPVLVSARSHPSVEICLISVHNVLISANIVPIRAYFRDTTPLLCAKLVPTKIPLVASLIFSSQQLKSACHVVDLRTRKLTPFPPKSTWRSAAPLQPLLKVCSPLGTQNLVVQS